MTTWLIPGKTFLLGEYAALHGFPAILILTKPCFRVTIKKMPFKPNEIIHPESPAGKFWSKTEHPYALKWHDPYCEKGGLGASSAQFIGAYFADALLKKRRPTQAQLLEAYYGFAWQGHGLRPSGYDVIAQCASGCTYINTERQIQQSYEWPFRDLGFILLHTENKLPTHQHLKDVLLTNKQAVETLAKIVLKARQAFIHEDAQYLIDAVNDYYQQLKAMHLVTHHCQQAIESLRTEPGILAMKGCGAMGSDVLLLLTVKKDLPKLSTKLSAAGWHILATQQDLYTKTGIFENFSDKTLEILA